MSTVKLAPDVPIPATPKRARADWMDALRGASILLVIFGHAVQLASMYTQHDFTRMSTFVGVIGPLRMPFLFFLSGMLVPRSLAKSGVDYFRGKLTKILWPYVLWSVILIALSWWLTLTLTWWRVPSVWEVVVAPIEHLWFLAYILVFYAAAYLTRKIDPLWCVLAATALMALPIPGEWGRIAYMAVPFFLGITMASRRAFFDRVTGSFLACAALFGVTVAISVGAVLGHLSVPDFSWSLPIMLAFFLGAVGVVKPIADHRVLAPLRFVGVRSIVLYIVHWPLMLALVPLLVTRGVNDPWTLFWIALVFGFVPAATLAYLSDKKVAVRWLFEWNPRPPRVAQPHGSSTQPGESSLHPPVSAGRQRAYWSGSVAAWAVSCVLLPLLVIRSKMSVGGSNVDDYLYAFVSLQLGSPLQLGSWVDGLLHSGQISPLVLALASLTPADATPYMSTAAQVAFMSLLFWSIRGIAMHLAEPHPTLWALVAVSFPAMIAWTAMFHFTVAAAALLAACAWAYAVSDRLTKLRPTLLFGLAVGALSLSRTVALVYVAALAVAVSWHLLRRFRSRRTLGGLASAGVVALIVAGPWWIVSGAEVFDYLLGAGYDSGSGFAPDRSVADRIANRFTHTVAEWGWPVTAVLALLTALWIASVARDRRRPSTPPAVEDDVRDLRRMLLLLVLVGLVVLSTSSNSGTAFSLPFAPLLILAVTNGSASLRSQLPRRIPLVVAATVAGLTLALSALSTHLQAADAMRLSGSWHSMAHNAGWDEGTPGPEEIHHAVAVAVQGRGVVLARDDVLLNANGLIFTSRYVGPSIGLIRLAPFGQEEWTPTSEELDGAVVLSGRSPANFHQVNAETLASHLVAIEYVRACELRLGTENVVELWAPGDVPITCPESLSSPSAP